VDIQVDGGITALTAPRAVSAGANVLVAGSAIFGAGDYARAIRSLRAASLSPM
jgi:ribulose-phosphate 3-epimerase